MPTVGEVAFNAVVVDEVGNQNRARESVTREGVNTAPEITSTPNTVWTIDVDSTYVYQVEAEDIDGDDLNYILLDAPTDAEIDENGLISFTPEGIFESSYEFTVQVDDGRGGADTQTFTVDIFSENLGTIKGIKWEDLNENGVRDSDLVQGANPDVVYVLDVSGSADFYFVGTSIGDVNNDGLEDTRLDAEIAAFIALNDQLITQGLGDRARVAIVVYSGFAANADMNLVTDGFQLSTTLGADNNNNGINDIEEILLSISSGAFSVGNNTGTNPEAALQRVEDTFSSLGTEGSNGNLIFLTDGESNRGGSISDEVNRLRGAGFNLSAFGVGDDASLDDIQTIDPDGIRFSSIDEILEAFGGIDDNSQSIFEPLLSGVTVYLDLNNNGTLDNNEPFRITAEDDLNTPDIDETGQYEFNNLPAGTYIVREVVPEGFEQTFPTSTETGVGDGYADVILDYFNSGTGTFDEPYGSNNSGAFPVLVPVDIILGSDTQGALSLPTGSFVTVGFIDEIIIDGPGDDIFIPEVGAAGERAEVFVSSDFENFTFLGIGNGGTTSIFDLASIDFTEPVRAIKIVGLDNGGASPGFDVINVQGLPDSIASPDFYTIELADGEVVENINFGNVKLANQDPTIISTPIIEAVAGQPYEYLVRAKDPDGDLLTFSLNQAPEGMVIDPETGLISYAPPIKDLTLNFNTSDSQIKTGLDNQKAFTNDNQGIGFTDTTGNYAIGESFLTSNNRPVGPVFRSAVSFNLSLLSSPVTSAKLQLQKNATSGDPIETLGLFEVTTNANTLYTSSYVSPAIFEDLGTGTSYGTFDVATGGNRSEILEFELNQAAITAINMKSGDFFSIGLALLSANPNNNTEAAEYLFAFSTSAGIQRLVLETENKQTIEIFVNDGKGGEVAQTYTLNIVESSTNQAPLITSTPETNITLGETYEYQVEATDPNNDPLSYSLIDSPDGMKIDEFGKITWNSTAIGEFTLSIEVSDGKGGVDTQVYNLKVVNDIPLDTEAPKVNLGFNGTVFKLGETINLQIQGFDNVGLADLDLSFNGSSLALNPDLAVNGLINNTSLTLNTTGVFEVVAKATDLAGNIDTETLSVRVLDPNDTSAPIAQLDISDFDPLNLVIREKTEIKGTINDENLEFYRVEIAPVSLINLSNPGEKDPDYITIAEGTENIDGVLATIDPALYRNDNYFVRIYAQDINGTATVEGFGVGLESQTKPGEFSLEYTDLSIPVAGIPIEITRSYSSLDSSFQGDFGYGWSLGLQDAQITEAAPDGRNLNFDNFFGGNSLTIGTRVTLTTPNGRRVGFTFDPQLDGGGFFGARYAPVFRPDPGVEETLEVAYTPLSIFGDGSVGLYLFGFTYNPSDYTLTTKNGTEYNYNQYNGLQTVEDRNGNTLTFEDDGITSSTGVEIDFIRDSQGRITEIVDPEGNSLIYTYDENGDLVGFGDRNENETTFLYEAEDPHYLTEVIDPLGRTGVRTEYDENGQISKIFDADGNFLALDYDSANSRQTVTDPFGNTTTFVFDARGNVVSEIDALGGVTTRTYDEENNLLTETEPDGDTTSYTYDDRANVLTETDGEGNTTTYIYSADNDVLTETDANGNVTTNTYDANGNLISRADANGNVTTYGYGLYSLLTGITDAEGNESTFDYNNRGYLTQLNDPSGAEYTFTYDNNGNVTSLVNDLGQTFTFTYDNEGRQISQQDAEGNACGCSSKGVTQTEYNAFGDKVGEIDANGNRTEYVYSDRGLLIETIYPDGTPDNLDDNPRILNEYDELDQLIAVTDELGRVTYNEYDALNRLAKTIYPDATPNDLTNNPFIQTEYYADGLVAAEIDELGNRTEFEYDSAGNLIVQRDGFGNETTFEYDAVGNQVAMVDANGNRTEYTYDGLGQLIETEYADNTLEEQVYSPLGYIIEVIDQAGVSTEYEYDGLGRLTKVIDALGSETEYIRDTAGNILQQIDTNGHIITFTYDDLNRVATNTLPLGQLATTTYDAVGNVKTTTDYNGVVTTYEYDERNRLISRAYSDGTPTETFTYTLTGQLESVTDNRGTTVYEYDARDMLMSRTEPDGRKIEYTYNAAGNILSLIAESGVTVYTYDALNRIDTVIDADSSVTDYDYDAVGNLVTTIFGNGIVENRDYDNLNRLISLENVNDDGVISSFDYTLDAVGNRIRIEEEDGRITEYDYDLLYRLTEESVADAVNGDYAIEYVYDAVGNRLQKVDSVDGITTYVYDDNDRLLSETTDGVVTQYQYDDAGNLTATIVDGETTQTLEWNAKGELTAVEIRENGETGRIEYEYDHNGVRVAININGEETRFLIDNNQQEYAQVIEEYTPDGDVINAYTYGWDLISQDDGTDRVYYQVDGLGSTRLMTSNSGAIVVEYDYDAYGNLTRKVGDAENNYLFAGEQFDDAVDGYYLRARYYDPNTGRFASVDPFEGYNNQPITLHDYLYVGVNPVNAIDPSGEVAIEYRATLAPSLALLSTVRTATLTSNVGTFSIRSIPVGIAISCVFLKTASALYLASQGLLSESSALNCGFDAKDKWICEAKCNVDGTPSHCSGKRVNGLGSGPSEELACRNAKRSATQKAPRGCYARHCRCECRRR
jgi:RHS repeat-associated protein